MTTIATDGRSIACDTRITDGNFILPSRITKIHRVGDRYIGIAGLLELAPLYLEFLTTGKKPDKKLKQFEAIILEKDGTVYSVDSSLSEIEVQAPYAIGSGGMIATGAMCAGASPGVSIEIAARFDAGTTNDVLVYKVSDLKRKPKKDE